MTPRETAHWLAANYGWHVFPVGPDKKPLPGFRWKDLASDSHEVIDQMPWEQAAMPAVYCGKSGIAVLDIDTPEGREQLQRILGALPPTQQQNTPRGGSHLIFKAPPFPQSIGTNIPCKGVDVRAGVGYICWYGQGEGLDWDTLAWPFKAPLAPPVNGAEPHQTAPQPPGAISLAVPEGGRNHDLARAAGAILRSQPTIGLADYLNQLLDYCRQAHTPPLPLEEIKATAISILRKHRRGEEAEQQQVQHQAQLSTALRETIIQGVISSGDLARTEHPPWNYICHPWIVEGYTIYAGPPKIGKTTLMRQLAICVAQGEDFLGMPVKKCKALFISLEEGDRLFHSKLMRTGRTPEQLDGFNIAFEWPKGEQGVIALYEYMQAYPDTELILIDNYQAFNGSSGESRQTQTTIDYQIGSRFTEFCKRHQGLALVMIAHTRKMEADSPNDRVSGTNGVTAPADMVAVLGHNPMGYFMHWAGRRWEQDECDFELLRDSGQWRLAGPASPGVPKLHGNATCQAEIVRCLRETAMPMTGKAIAFSLNKSEPEISRACNKLEEMGLIHREGRKWTC